jgi:hypothetical protein
MNTAVSASSDFAMPAPAVANRARLARTLALVLAGSLLAACGVPEHMLVDQGTFPQNVDKDVRFRTTYYFRIFDYCWNRNTGEQAYIPETDTLYRYRMTGKAHSLLSAVKFESGILSAAEIDPFGTDVVFDNNINGFRVRDATAAKEESERIELAKEAAARAKAREATRDSAFERYLQLRDAYLKVKEPEGADDTQKAATAKIREQLELAMQEALTAYVSDLALTLPAAQQSEIVGLSEQLKELSDKVSNLVPSTLVTTLSKAAADLTEAAKGKAPADQAAIDALSNKIKDLAEALAKQEPSAQIAALLTKVEAFTTLAEGKSSADQDAIKNLSKQIMGVADTLARQQPAAQVAALSQAATDLVKAAEGKPAVEQDALKKLSGQANELADTLAKQEPPPGITDLLQAAGNLTKAVESGQALEQLCPADKPTVRRGFQVMGPEGWKTFNQDERLVMAMSSSAKPLIGTLQEYAGRILQSRYNPADALLPLVRENLVTVQAQQAAERQDPATASVETIFDKATASFGGP